MKELQDKASRELAQTASLMSPWSGWLLPDEDATDYETLRGELFSDLLPRTPYERVLAENLVELECEAFRSRRLKAGILKSVFRDKGAEVIDKRMSVASFIIGPSEVAKGIVEDILSSDGKRRANAEAKLAEMELDLNELTAVAYRACAKDLEPLERNLEALERRRRNLLEDFRKLQDMRANVIEEVQLLEEDE